jgi:hypothetical protein
MEFVIPLILRLIGSLLILKKPFWGMAFAMALDTVDFEVIAFLHEIFKGGYYVYYPTYVVFDKTLDLYVGMLGLIAARVWEPLIQRTMIGLWFWRIIGVILFLVFDQRYIFFFFPYVFDLFYLYYSYIVQYKPELKPTTPRQVATVVAILLIPKLMQEYFLHIIDSRPLVHLRYDILKLPR